MLSLLGYDVDELPRHDAVGAQAMAAASPPIGISLLDEGSDCLKDLRRITSREEKESTAFEHFIGTKDTIEVSATPITETGNACQS